MSSQLKHDIPRTRETILFVATKFNIYFFFAMAMIGSVLFLVGLFSQGTAFIDNLPKSVVFLTVGLFVFCLFFPWFTALFFARHFLYSIARLENEMEKLKSRTISTDG